MENNYLLTVLLISYNHVDTFEKSIQSVLNQRTNFEYKVIILDDASNDGTQDLIKKYENNRNVESVIQEVNIGGQENIYNGIKSVKTKYYTVLEADDYWSDETKLQKQIDILENNPDCSMCAHNTLVNYVQTGIKKPYIKSETKKYTIPKKIPGHYYIEPHTSSRIYRTECLELNKIKNPKVVTYDISANFYFLLKGKLYYIDEIMSVYNYTNKGIYSGASPYMQRYKSALAVYELNKEFDFKYNKLLSRFFSTRINLSYFTYLSLKLNKDLVKLDELYKKSLLRYQSDYLSRNDMKPIFRFSIPVSKRKKIIFEMKREKERV